MKKRLYVIAIIITLVLSTLMVKVQAADLSYTASMKANSDSVEKGKEFIVTLSVSNIKAGDKGINSLSGYLEFDTKVFEEITAENIDGSNDWNVTYSEDTGKITLLKTSFVKETQEVCKITLKTKSSTTSTKGTIEFKDIVASNSESEIATDDISLEVGIGAASNSNSNNTIKITSNNTNKNTNTNTNTNSNTNKNISANTNKNTNSNNSSNSIVANTNKNNTNKNNTNVNNANIANETNEEEMPDTGLDDTIVKAIILVGLVGAIGYIKMKSLDKK